LWPYRAALAVVAKTPTEWRWQDWEKLWEGQGVGHGRVVNKGLHKILYKTVWMST
jgi:hypothetical protein